MKSNRINNPFIRKNESCGIGEKQDEPGTDVKSKSTVNVWAAVTSFISDNGSIQVLDFREVIWEVRKMLPRIRMFQPSNLDLHTQIKTSLKKSFRPSLVNLQFTALLFRNAKTNSSEIAFLLHRFFLEKWAHFSYSVCWWVWLRFNL